MLDALALGWEGKPSRETHNLNEENADEEPKTLRVSFNGKRVDQLTSNWKLCEYSLAPKPKASMIFLSAESHSARYDLPQRRRTAHAYALQRRIRKSQSQRTVLHSHTAGPEVLDEPQQVRCRDEQVGDDAHDSHGDARYVSVGPEGLVARSRVRVDGPSIRHVLIVTTIRCAV